MYFEPKPLHDKLYDQYVGINTKNAIITDFFLLSN